MSKRVFITGASGCVGHYLTETLLLNTDYELFLLVRDRQKLTIDVSRRPGVEVIEADMAEIDRFHDLVADDRHCCFDSDRLGRSRSDAAGQCSASGSNY